MTQADWMVQRTLFLQPSPFTYDMITSQVAPDKLSNGDLRALYRKALRLKDLDAARALIANMESRGMIKDHDQLTLWRIHAKYAVGCKLTGNKKGLNHAERRLARQEGQGLKLEAMYELGALHGEARRNPDSGSHKARRLWQTLSTIGWVPTYRLTRKGRLSFGIE